MEIHLPTPDTYLTSPPALLSTASTLTKRPAQARGTNNKKKKKKKSSSQDAVDKPKQSKSRNGCSTCKRKRLKCDETKPTCVQCERRNVQCEGYKRDYKWKLGFATASSFEKKSPTVHEAPAAQIVPSSELDSYFASASATIAIPRVSASASISTSPITTPAQHPGRPQRQPSHDLGLSIPDLPSPGHNAEAEHTPPLVSGQERSPLSSLSTETVDCGNEGVGDGGLAPVDSQRSVSPAQDPAIELTLEEADEEVQRTSSPWDDDAMPATSPSPSDVTNSSQSIGLTMLTNPSLDLASPEMLLARFDQQTCGILSVKDGPTENPWRTLVWPLAQHSEALYHAISSMTAFHGAYEVPRLRIAGVAHMTKSIRKLAADIGNMKLDCALATSLALAFGEGWDEKTSTGIQHLRGARIMVDKALTNHRANQQIGLLDEPDAVRLKFLCNTFIYLDVIARLTSKEVVQDLNFEDILLTVNQPTGEYLEMDPLMGCGLTLFPLVGRVAHLAQRVRNVDTNSLAVVSQAMELKQQLLQWKPPDYYMVERPEDPTSDVQHAIQTAEAYRYATLLYLHQAVPENPSDTAAVLAKRVLLLLASVPLSSRTLIVQIFPLFAASCEVVSHEDRMWVIERWSAMISRLRIGNVDSCWNVVQEVWRRRDEFEEDKTHRLMRRYTSRGLSTSEILSGMPHLQRRATATDSPFDQIEPEYTIRGKLHWVGVMSDWNWEVFLG